MANPILVYVAARYPSGINSVDEPIVVLAKDNWDDYTFKTTFDVFVVRGAERLAIGSVRVLVEKTKVTSEVLDAAPAAAVGGHQLDFGGRPFLSLGSDLEYYKELIRLLPDRTERDAVLAALHDTVFLEQKLPEIPDLDLRRSEGFRTSLLRGTSQTKAYGQARRLLFADELNPDRFNFTLRFQLQPFVAPHEFRFRFDPDVDEAKPTNIVVLIGKNGLGKTQALYHVVDYLLGEGHGEPTRLQALNFVPFEPRVEFRHVIAVSFSPFEQFPIRAAAGAADANSSTRSTSSPRYTYCGFRELSGSTNNALHNAERVAWQRTSQALIEILQHDEDQLLKVGDSDRPKFASLLRVLKEGLDYESLMLLVPPEQPIDGLLGRAVKVIDGKSYLDVREAEDGTRKELLALLRAMPAPGELRFRNDDGTLVSRFSAGQAMFLFMVFGVIAGVQRDSLVLVDEPELYLHPNLEVAYLRMLTTLLQLFESYAIIATHSVFVARETPARNVFIVSEGEGRRPLIDSPSIETFGADISEIANLAFDNISADKPFQRWLRTLIGNEQDYSAIRARFGKLLNAESLTYLRNKMTERNERAERKRTDEQVPPTVNGHEET